MTTEGETMNQIDLLAQDVLDAAAGRLGPGEGHLVVGAELGPQARIALLEQGADGVTVGLSHRPADLGDDALLTAANHLAVGSLHELPELTRVIIGRAMHEGGRLRVHARPVTGEVSLGLMHASGRLVEIIRRHIAAGPTAH